MNYPIFYVKPAASAELWSAITRWLLVLQLGNCPEAQNCVVMLQSKIHPCVNIARKAKSVGFSPHCITLGLYTLQRNMVSCLTGLPVWYSCWVKSYRAWAFLCLLSLWGGGGGKASAVHIWRLLT